MPRIDNDIKLDFKDVLLRPKRSTLKSRSEVDLKREFVFRNSKGTYSGIPIIAANMDTVGTFDMAKALAKFSLFTAIHKHYSLEEWKDFASSNPDCLQSVAVSAGMGTNDFERLCSVLESVPDIRYICLDVANGYSEHFVEFVKDVRQKFPEHTIMVRAGWWAGTAGKRALRPAPPCTPTTPPCPVACPRVSCTSASPFSFRHL
ncbi:GMP reductase 2-like [Rhinoraja longicauda]